MQAGLGEENARQSNLGQRVQEQQSRLDIELLVVGDDLEEFEVEDVEAGGVKLADLHLFEQRFAKDGHWDVFHSFEDVDEVFEHQVSNVELPVELNQDKGERLVQLGRYVVLYFGEKLKESEH